MITNLKKTGKRDFYQNIFLSTFIGLVAIGIIVFLVISNLRIGQKRGEMTKQIESLEKEIQTLQEKKSKLEAGITETQDESYWEEKVREQGYKKPGEEQVVVLPPEENQQATSTKQKNFFEKFLEKIGF